MDLLLIGASVLFLGGLFWLIYLWQKKIDQQEHHSHAVELQAARQYGTHHAIAQFPQINSYLCIGCGSCIKACPEDHVIGLVQGVAQILHGSRCIGHSRCEVACPVGAIKVGLGNVALRPDIPLLSEQYETSVPGIFIAGELGGMALIRNAIHQGTEVISTLAREKFSPHQTRGSNIYDVLIVGAGPAGLAASLKAVECKLNYKTIDLSDIGGTISKYPRRKLTLVQDLVIPLYGTLKGGEYEKETLIDLWKAIIKKFNINVETSVQLMSVSRNESYFEAATTTGIVRSRSLVLCLGRRGIPKKLNVVGEELPKVMYQLIDASSYLKQNILVVGGGDSAIEAATGLADQPGNIVTLSYRKDGFFRIKKRNEERIHDYKKKGKINLLFSSEVTRINPGSVNLKTRDKANSDLALPNDYVFIFVGGEPPYTLLKNMGIRFGGQ